jgi:hypothetical protein
MDEGVETPEEYPFEDVVSRWDVVIEEMAAMATEYEADGWETVTLHPGDVTISTGQEPNAKQGFDVVVPGDEYDRLRGAVDDRAFESYEVFRTADQGLVFLLTVLTDTDGDLAVFVPAYYPDTDVEELQVAVEKGGGTLTTHVRPLKEDERVLFYHEDPSLFLPEGYEDAV